MAEPGATVMETPRLRLRTFRAGDLPLLAAMNADPEVMRWLGGPVSLERSAEMVRLVEESFPATSRGMIPVERRADGAFLGIAGLTRLSWFPEEIEVGWRLRPEFWGQGYATEAGQAWIDRAFRVHGAARVISVADVPNQRSRAVMERLGMRLDHVARLREGEDEFEAAVYAVTREAWGATPPIGRGRGTPWGAPRAGPRR